MPHWTQTPAGRRRMKRIARLGLQARARNRRAEKKAPKAHPSQETNDGIEEGTFSYALGYIECWLQGFATAAGVSQRALTARVGAVLHRKASR